MIRSNTPSLVEPAAPFRPSRTPPRIAVIGCGAIAEVYHLPALAANRGVRDRTILVDLDQDRLQVLSARFGIPQCTSHYRDVVDQLDGAIVAVPPAHHHAITMDLLSRGIHVLCEKPLAESSAAAREMVAEADRSGTTLCVNHTRRLFPASQHVRELIAGGSLGEIREIRYVEGSEFSWQAATGFHFRSGSRGVLADRGIHVLDLICWWLGAKPELVSSLNDSCGGPEGVAQLRLRHETCEIEVKVSWLSRLANTYSIRGESGTVDGDVDHWRSIDVGDRSEKRHTRKLKCREDDYNDFGRRMVDNFIGVISRGEGPLVPAREVIWPIELMEECYERSTTFDMPWL